MNGEIAQYVALVCQGNSFFAGHPVPDLLATNSTCQFCESITFDGAGATRAANPNLWLHSLREDGVYGFRLSSALRNDPRFSDRMTAGFTGGGSFWNIEALKRDGSSDFYTARWAVGDRAQPESRIWTVSYPRYATQRTAPASTRSVAAMTGILTGALNQIQSFAQAHRDCEPFLASFARALGWLHGQTPDIYHRDLFSTDTLSPEAANLLNACQAAWVFGGMGTWNDMGFDDAADQSAYEAVSNFLYNALKEAIPVAVNDSFRPLR